MDNYAIELQSVNAVKDSIVMSDFLSPYIAENDKEPSWDGSVYIYGEKGKKKENLIGRVAVQVKGTEQKIPSNGGVSFPMSLIDLNNYLSDGGVMLFVVYIQCTETEVKRKIYYSALPPIKLRMIIASAEGQKNKSIALKEFPVDNKGKATIFLNCYNDCKKQTSFSDAKLYSLDELRQSGNLEGLKVFVSSFGEDSPENLLFNNEVYLYADIKGSTIPQPLEAVLDKIVKTEVRTGRIVIGGKELYSEYKFIKTKDSTAVQIGESFTITFPKNEAFAKMKYTESKSVRALTKDLEFMIMYVETGCFSIDDIPLPFDYEHANFSNFKTDDQKERLEYLKQVVQVLDLLGYKGDLSREKITAEEDRILERLVTAFIEKKPVTGLKVENPCVTKMSIGDASFALFIRPCEEKGMCEIFDFFKTEIPISYDYEGEEKLPTSQYMLLSADNICNLSNLRAEVFLPSFQMQPRHKDTFGRATEFLLKLLEAFDMSGGNRDDLLNAALSFAEWIQTADETEMDKRRSRLNYLQTIKRKRPLNIMEMNELYSIAEDENADEDCKVAAYLLLELQPMAQRHFERMSEKLQEVFKNFPICHFWKDAQA